MEIFARREQLPPPNEDEFYYDDLVGLEAVDAAGAPLGRVASLMNHGAGDVLEIAPAGGGETLLLPFTKGVVPRIDFDDGRITKSALKRAELAARNELQTITARFARGNWSEAYASSGTARARPGPLTR